MLPAEGKIAEPAGFGGVVADEMRANNSLALEREGAACSFRAGQRGGVKEAGVSDFLQAAHVFSDRALSAGGGRESAAREGASFTQPAVSTSSLAGPRGRIFFFLIPKNNG